MPLLRSSTAGPLVPSPSTSLEFVLEAIQKSHEEARRMLEVKLQSAKMSSFLRILARGRGEGAGSGGLGSLDAADSEGLTLG